MKSTNIVFATLLLSGCAAYEKAFVENSCSYQGGYESGTNSANSGEKMDSRHLNICPPESKAEAKRGYLEGYTKASESKTSHDFVKGVAGILTHVNGSNETHNILCFSHLFGKKYSATGTTEATAKQAANAKCKASRHGPHCHSMIYDCTTL